MGHRPCMVHCPGGGGGLGAALGVLAAVAVVPAAYAVIGSVIAAVVAAEAVVAVAMGAALRHLYKYGRARKPRRVVQRAPVPGKAVRALPAPLRAIEGRVVPRTLTGWDNGTPATGGVKVAVSEPAGAVHHADVVQAVRVRGGAPGPAGARQGVPGQVPVPPGR